MKGENCPQKHRASGNSADAGGHRTIGRLAIGTRPPSVKDHGVSHASAQRPAEGSALIDRTDGPYRYHLLHAGR
jgi:hypothetical protein